MTALAMEVPQPAADRGAARRPDAIEAIGDQLRSLRALLVSLGAADAMSFGRSEIYSKTVSRVSGSVGEHVRHVLDHVAALLAHDDSTVLSYDSRLRGTAVERNVAAALAEVERLSPLLDRLDERALAVPVRLAVVTRRDRGASHVFTTRGREAAFVVQHTTHHCAVIALLLERNGIDVPAGFGYAASTPLPAGH